MPSSDTNSGTWANEPMRALDGAVFFATCCAVGLFIILLTVRGVEYFDENVLPGLLDLSLVLTAGVVLAGLLYVRRKARPALLLYLSPVSILLGFIAWTYAFTLTARFAGPAGLAVGFSLGGVGVFPIGLVAAIFSHELVGAAVMTAITLAALAARALGDRCARKSVSN